MRHRIGTVSLLLSALLLAGCQGGPGRKMASAEPPLVTSPDASSTLVQADPSRSVTVVDRHPLLSAPRDFWNNTNNNKAIKAASATLVGVPVGLVGEVKQIVVGVPPDLRNQ
jgi:hypothetical protein